MSTPSRTARSARNIAVSVVTQVAVIVLGFLTRTVFLAQLGVAMVGVNALLTSALALLAFADLGVSGALMYALYKPLRDGDTRTTAAIVHYAGRVFRVVAVVVAIIGVGLTPFIPRLVRLDHDIEHIEIYYLVLLANTVVGYLMLNRVVLLNADQRIYLTKTYSLVFTVLRTGAQIVSLLLFQSFLWFLVIQVVFTAANNMTVYHRTGRLYPYVRGPVVSLAREDRRAIVRSTAAMSIYRVGGLVLNNSTPLLVSTIVGTVALGYYSNYLLIVGAAVMLAETSFSAVTPSVGHLVAGEGRSDRRRVFDELVLLAVLIHGFVAICFAVLLGDVVRLWLGGSYVLSPDVVAAIVINFYVVGASMPLWSFRTATGLFRQAQLVMLLTAGLSIGLSFLLGPLFGLAGVLAAPVVARLSTGAWFEPWLLIRSHLSGRTMAYFGLQAGVFLLWAALALVVILAGASVPGGPVAAIAVKVVLIAVLFPGVTWIVFRRTAAFRSLADRMRLLLRKSAKGAV